MASRGSNTKPPKQKSSKRIPHAGTYTKKARGMGKMSK